MLTFERILTVFADYLAADTDVEVIQTRHGYTYLVWDICSMFIFVLIR